ncbi:MAG: hypothetical protein LBB49_03650 [Gracilibacteraceae bacterium]|jgi:predicted DNA-binding protein YlxM (UPF0122 family)|nr:hypothetical protein [Gracilibacteraceae bacterium]
MASCTARRDITQIMDGSRFKQKNSIREWAYKTLLFDFYAPLLTGKQRFIWDGYYLKDLSLVELAREQSTSRQAVHSLLQRTQEILERYEEKLGLIERFLAGRDYLLQVDQRLQSLESITRENIAQESMEREFSEIRVLLQKALDTY